MGYSFKDIGAWKAGHEFVLAVYKATEMFPAHEVYGLTSQFRRAAVSIPANIAEGFRKLSYLDKLRFMNISQGSLEESRYYILLSRDLGYISEEVSYDLNAKVESTSRLLNAYCKGIIANKEKYKLST